MPVTPFGLSGPKSGWASTSLVDQAASGWLLTTGWPDRPPLALAGELPALTTGINAAVAGLAALHERARSGCGQIVDVSVQETLVGLQHSVTAYAYTGRVPQRHGDGQPGHYVTLIPCRDGDVGITTVTPESWEMLCVWAGHPELLEDPRFATGPLRSAHTAELDAVFKPWGAQFSKLEFEAEGQAYRIPIGVVASMEDVWRSPQHAARRFFQQAGDGGRTRLVLPRLPFLLDGRPASSATAPAQAAESGGEDRRRKAPLAGLTVLDLTRWWSGPLAGRLLGDFGADVIKIEALDRYDPYRGNPNPTPQEAGNYPGSDPGDRPYDRRLTYTSLNRNKRHLSLDITQPAGRDTLLRLVAQADVVLENFSRRVMPNLGLDYSTLASVRPDLVMLSLPAFGATGPHADYVAFGGSVEWVSGFTRRNGFPDRPMMMTGRAMPDPVAGLFGSFAVLAALARRQRGGAGCHIDLSQLEAFTIMNLDALLEQERNGQEPRRLGNGHARYAPYGVYPAAGDDAWIAIAVTGSAAWRALCKVIGAPDLAESPALRTAGGRQGRVARVDERIAAWTSSRVANEAATLLQEAGVAAAALASVADLLRDPHLAARDFIVTLEGAAGRYPFAGPPARFSRSGLLPWCAAPAFGAHRREVLRTLAGLSEQAIDALEAQGVTGSEPRLRGETHA